MHPRRSPRDLPYQDLPVRGGMWLDDETRPPGYARVVVNMLDGEVRRGSLSTRIVLNSNGIMAGGLFGIRTPQGTRYKLALAGTTTPIGYCVDGSLTAYSSQFVTSYPRATTTTYHANAVVGSAAIPATWGRIGNRAIVAGPLEGKIGVFEFPSSGRPVMRVAYGFDRTVEPYSAGDDAGPYLRTPPYAVACCVHQNRVVVVDQNGVVWFSNAGDPDGWPYNNRFYLQDALGAEATTCIAGAAEGHLVVSQRDGLWVVEGGLADIATTTIARRSVYGRGFVAPGSVQTVDSGVVVGLSAGGPFMWANGNYIPAGGKVGDTHGPLDALFNGGHMDDFDLDRYRPLVATLPRAISKYDRVSRTYTVAMGAVIDSGDDPADHRLRLCWHIPTNRWWMEVHPPTRALLSFSDTRGGVGNFRGDGYGDIFIEGVGDYDQKRTSIIATSNVLIKGRLQVPFIETTPERARPRFLHTTLRRDWNSRPEVSVLGDGRSTQSEQTVTVAVETRDRAFALGETDGFVLGTAVVESDQTVTVKRGLPEGGVGRRVRVEYRTPSTATAGHRFALVSAQLELAGGGKTP